MSGAVLLGGLLLLMVVVLVAGNLWFHLVEGVLGWLKGRLGRHREPPAWHPLPPEGEDGEGDS